MKVSNMESHNGNKIPNQFIIGDEDRTYSQSYDSIIACKKSGKVELDKTYWDYSVTTSKYRNLFLGETKKETEKKIKDGTYILSNLN